MAEGGGGCGRLIVIGLAALIILPIFITAGSTAFFCRKVIAPAPSSGKKSCADEPGSPCAGALEVFAAAAAADTEKLRGLLADPGWLERLPPAATSKPEELGEYLVRKLLGETPASIEELRGMPTTVRAVVARTELLGRKSVVGLEVGALEKSRMLVVEMQRRDGGWKLVPPVSR